MIEQLRQRIGDGTWSLHQRLPVEAALAKELGVGRSTIREAVRVLVHAGLLEVRQGSGTYVRARQEIDAALRRLVTGADLLQAFEVRRALEVEIARLAAQHRSAADLTRLRELAEHREHAYKTGSVHYRKADSAFRDQLLEATGNPLLANLYRGVVQPLRTHLPTQVDDGELTRDNVDNPETPALIEAIERRDPDAAAAAAERQMGNVMRVLQFLLQAMNVEHQ